MTRPLAIVLGLIIALVAAARPCHALDDAHHQKAQQAIARGTAFLRTTQGSDGSWSVKPGPAVTALALTAMLDQPNASITDPTIAKALAFVLSKKRPDGSIQDGILENYNTSICLSALARANDQPGVAEAIKQAQDYLRQLQWAGQLDPQGKPIDAQHPFYGGAGYGKDGRPDMSNTQMMLQGLHDSGLDCQDPAFQRALVFITRCQGTSVNKEFGAKIVPDGGFIYSTSENKAKIGTLESKAGATQWEDGTTRLVTYGSMTYAGFKSYLYAKLDRHDQRVQDAFKWVQHHYTLDQNPGLPDPVKLQGLYYYYLTFARALHAWGESTITTADGQVHDWRNELIDKLTSLQDAKGSWTNAADRWMEADPNLVTCYALIALTEATK